MIGSLENNKELKKSRLDKLSPFVDEEGLLRSKSRLEYAEYMSEESKNPIILSGKDPLARLYINHVHAQIHHPLGRNALRGKLMKRFLIQSFYVAENRIDKSCFTCTRKKAVQAEQIQAPLPTSRFDEGTRPFTNAGMDFLGPFPVKQRRATRASTGETNAYVLLLTCYTTRAVHCEVTYKMTTQAVYNALSRFCDRRGIPKVMYSDNQTSFQALDKELKEMYKHLNMDEVKKMTEYGFKQSEGIEWRFNTPTASHHGSPFEIMVKAFKRAFRATHGYSCLSPDEFLTATTNCERLMNSRPLSVAKIEAAEPPPLTPNHFLLLRGNSDLSPPTSAEPQNLGQRWRRLQELQDHFWRRFHTEILPQLNPRKMWTNEKKNLEEGTLALEIDPNTPRGLWKHGIITSVQPSKDQRVRTVTIRMANGHSYKRPINKLIPLG